MQARLKALSLKGVLWSAGEGAGVAVLSFASFLVMARWLEPRDFGLAALASVFVFFCNLVLGHVFTDALVQRPERDAVDRDTAHWATMASALALMGGCWLLAPALGAWMGEPLLAPVLQAASLCLPIGALASTPIAIARGDMRFAVVAQCSLAGRLAGAATGVWMALTGWGMWSLVGQQLAAAAVGSLAVFVAVSWWPRLRFSRRSLGELSSYGFHVSASYVIGGAGEQVLNLIVGALFGTTALGYFAVALRVMQLVRHLMSSAVYYVGLSAFARLKDDRAALARAFLQSTRMSCLAGFPVGIGLSVASAPLITLLSGPKWSASGPLLAIMALEMVPGFYALFTAALYRAVGHPGWTLSVAALSTVLGLAGAALLAPFGLGAIVAFLVLRTALLVPIHAALVRRLLPVDGRALVEVALAPGMAAIAMALAVAAVASLPEVDALAPAAALAVLGAVGAAVYLTATWLFSPGLVELAGRTLRTMLSPAKPS